MKARLTKMCFSFLEFANIRWNAFNVITSISPFPWKGCGYCYPQIRKKNIKELKFTMEIQDNDRTQTSTPSNDDSVYLGLIIFGSVVFALGEVSSNWISRNFPLFPCKLLFFILLFFCSSKKCNLQTFSVSA